MKTALAHGAQVEHRETVTDYGPFTCLHIAAYLSRFNATKMLLEKGANVDAETEEHQWTPIMLASWGEGSAIVKLLLEHNGSTDLKDRRGQTALHHAANSGNLSAVQLLVGKSNVNARDNEGKTPLGRAEEMKTGMYLGFGISKSRKNDVIRYLKRNGATL